MKISDAELEVMQVIWDKRRSNFFRCYRKIRKMGQKYY